MERKKLPIDDYRQDIVRLVKDNPVVILTAETGAGKSTRVPQFLLSEGYSLVVTQPRRLAARSVAKRVAQEYGCALGETVGFRTAYEKQDGPKTRCLFATDGLALIRELMGVGRRQVLVLDEVHEWNLNMEVLVAWSKRQLDAGAKFKLIIMSATLEAEKLSMFFNKAPIVSVPGRCFPVEEREPSDRMVDDVAELLVEGRNVLVFQSGKGEIEELIDDLAAKKLDVQVLPLHGELEAEEQDMVFRSYSKPKCIVSTNVAQTSITIEDIDAVVDSGTERRIELNNGVEGLYLKSVSLADREQRKGRAGRCREGVYIDHCFVKKENRLEFPKAEILRVRLDQTVLRLAEIGIDAEQMEFFHQPPTDQIHEAKRALHALGCLDEKERVTAIGHQVARLPISVQYGRMVVEADRLGVVNDIVDIASILEQGTITARKVVINDREYSGSLIWRPAFCPDEIESDVMAQLAVFRGAKMLSNENRRLNGVFLKGYHQARERRQLLADALRGKVRSFKSSGQREDILKALCAGMVDHLYRYYYGDWINGDNMPRQLAKESVVQSANWLVGLPFDLMTRRGLIRLVVMATKVKPEWLVEVAPQLVRQEVGLSPRWNSGLNACVSTRRTIFNDIIIKEEEVLDTENPLAVSLETSFREAAEEQRVAHLFEEKKREYGSEWIYDPKNVYPYFSYLLQRVLVTTREFGEKKGEVVDGWISLANSSSSFLVTLRNSLEKAEEETSMSLEKLFNKACVDVLSVPSASPWGSSYNRTDLGFALLRRIQEIRDNIGQVNLANFHQQIENLEKQIALAKDELSAGWADKDGMVRELEVAVKEVANGEVQAAVRNLRANIFISSLIEVETESQRIKKIIDELVRAAASLRERAESVQTAYDSIKSELSALSYPTDQFQRAATEDQKMASRLISVIENKIFDKDYDEAIAKIIEAQELLVAAKSRVDFLEDILQEEYSKCPMCGEDISSESHYCDKENEVELALFEEGIVKRTLVNGQELVRLYVVSGNVLVTYVDYNNLRCGGVKTVIGQKNVSGPEPTLDQIEALKEIWGAR